MHIDDLLAQLEFVRSRANGKWSARCPAHQDRSPSLSLRETDDHRLLVHCFAGCTVNAICDALGLRISDLFEGYEQDPHIRREAHQRRAAQVVQRKAEQNAVGRCLDALREAEYLIQCAKTIDISQWTLDQLDIALNRLADAYTLLESEEIYG